MTVAGYVPAIGETDLNKIIRSVRNLYENASTSTDIFPESYGAVGDGVTDDTAALRAWIAAYDGTQRLRLNGKPYLVSGTLTINKPIEIVGVGGRGDSAGTAYQSRIVVASSVNTSTDIFYIKPPAATLIRGITLRDFRIVAQSGTPGRHTIHLDTSGDTSSLIADVLLEGLRIDTGRGGTLSLTTGAQGMSVNSIYINNGNGDNNGTGGGGATGSLQGGTFNFTMRDCYVGGNITVAYGGDTLRFEDSIVTAGTVSVTQVAGAADLIWDNNNCSPVGGVTIYQAFKPVICRNEFEQQSVSTQASQTLTTSAGSAIGSNTLTFSSVPNSITQGLMISNVTHPASLTAGVTILSTTATTITFNSTVNSPGVSSGDVINFGGCILDCSGLTGALDNPVIRDNVFQSNASIGNTILLRMHGSTHALIEGNRFAPPISYAPVIVTPSSTSCKFGNGNYFVGLSWPNYLLDYSTTTEYPIVTAIQGTTAASCAANTTNYSTPNGVNTTESTIWAPTMRNGVMKNLAVWSTGAPGVGQSYVCTVRKEGADQALTTTISGGSLNSGQDITHNFQISQNNRYSIKFVSSATAAAAVFSYVWELHSF